MHTTCPNSSGHVSMKNFARTILVVQEPGPGVMRLRVGITEAGKNIPVLDNLTAPVPVVLSDGKKSLVGIQPVCRQGDD